MPLLEGTGVTNLGSNFTFFFGLVSHEDEDTFKWALEQYRHILEAHEIPAPQVLLSDFDMAFKNAAGVVFPRTENNYHILKNVVLHINKKWPGTLDGTRIMEDDEEAQRGI